MSDRRPRTEYDCRTLAINRDSGYVGDFASWRTWALTRAAFDRQVGRSRRGVLHDVVVRLDGERI